MQRKSFLATISTLVAGAFVPRAAALSPAGEDELRIRVPPYLKAGDTIAITSPAGAITETDLQPALLQLRSWGFNVRIGSSIGKKDFSFGGTDDQRCADMQVLLDDPKVAAILCARGGYGSARIVDGLDWSKFRKHPKWVIGFSDITVLHCHIHKHCGVASIHSKMCNSFPDDWEKAEPIQRETVLSIRDALQGKRVLLSAPANGQNRPGNGEGALIGGNLRTLENLAGTPSDIETKGKILFIEDTGEYAYSIDRMLENLRRGGKLARLAGLVVGGFKIKPDDPGEEFGRTLADIIAEKTAGTRYPIAFDFPIGHQRANFALKCGLRHQLQVGGDGSSLTELS
ncbi:MAG: LD-carboxypeptidase [Chitinophagaceae bacterium]|nr:MAG: LD-carboxypeptidase [Chitinophagaceae bacterium]